MNGYHQDLTTNIEHSRNCLRRIARNDDHEFSRESIVNLMEKFVKTVNAMDETILVPCRLMDRSIGDATDTVQVTPPKSANHHGKRKGKSVHENLNSADLFDLYTMLNEVKVDLLWGRKSEEQPEEVLLSQQPASMDQLSISEPNTKLSSNVTSVTATANGQAQQTKGHVRRPSTVSVASSNSTNTLSDTESEISNENDSGIESEHTNNANKSSELARQYRTHLLGLYRCLEQMTEASNYLTNRYQSDIGAV